MWWFIPISVGLGRLKNMSWIWGQNHLMRLVSTKQNKQPYRSLHISDKNSFYCEWLDSVKSMLSMVLDLWTLYWPALDTLKLYLSSLHSAVCNRKSLITAYYNEVVFFCLFVFVLFSVLFCFGGGGGGMCVC